MKGPIRTLLRRRLAKAARQEGHSPDEVESALDAMESERPLVDWFINGGWEQLLKMFLAILALFAADREDPELESVSR